MTPESKRSTLTTLFGSPLATHLWSDGEELNRHLLDRILVHAEAVPAFAKSNVGGWQSGTGSLEFCGDAGRRLIKHMYDMADETTRHILAEYRQPYQQMRWTVSAWANVNRNGNFNRVHTHPGSTWSGTYYVDPGDPLPDSENGTPLHLFDPYLGRGNTFLPPLVPAHFLVRPEPGLMVLFPSYIPHMVYPHQGSRPRVSIAFNLRREPFP